MSAAAWDSNLDTLSPSFMYTQVLKEILLTINFGEEHLEEFVKYCRDRANGNAVELTNLDKLKHEYHQHTPVWWYTDQRFLSSMVDRALLTMDTAKIVKLGFFIRDLHEQIVRLHSEQESERQSGKSFVVYSGQDLAREDFDEIRTKTGGLLGFNQFLLTNKTQQIPLDCARKASTNPDRAGVLFVMTIDPSVSLVPFANIRQVSAHQNEDEILFAMHSVFRIGEAKQIEGNNRLWQVELTLTSDNDQDLCLLTESIREEILAHESGWSRLAALLIRIGQFDQAEKIYQKILSETTDEQKKANIYDQLGGIKENQGEYPEATEFYEKSLAIKKEILPPTHSDVGDSYKKIASVYQMVGEYSKALAYYEQALEIQQKTFQENHPDLATTYDGIGALYAEMGENTKALSFYEKSLQIRLANLPPNHPDLSSIYSKIGEVYENLGEHFKALDFHEKALRIYEEAFPPGHPVLATSHQNLGKVYEKIGDHSKALSAYQRAHDIAQNTLPPNHPDLLLYQNNIEAIKKKL